MNKSRSKYQFVVLFFTVLVTGFVACKKYTDPAPTTDPRLTNPYCNDPAAVNYNWGFPGVPDNSKCFYPTDLFAGNYLYVDSVFDNNTGIYLSSDTLHLTLRALSHTKLVCTGFCGSGDSFLLTAYNYTATLDTLVGDTTTVTKGQFGCVRTDTVSGTIVDNLLDTTFHVNLQYKSDTVIKNHIGRAHKL